MIRRKCRAKRMAKAASTLVCWKSLDYLNKDTESSIDFNKGSKILRRQSFPFKKSKYVPRSNEDIRRSLEVLDNVLAEFDDHDIFCPDDDCADEDCDDDHMTTGHERPVSDYNIVKSDKCDSAKNRISNNSFVPTTAKHTNSHCQYLQRSSSFKSVPTDGVSSQASIELSDECRKYSPPPVPRRSPTTRLSNRDNPFFSKENPQKICSSSAHPDLTLKRSSGCDTESKCSTLSSSEGFDASPKNVTPISYLSGHHEITDEDAFAVNLCNSDEDVADDVFVPAAQQGSGHVSPALSAVCRACGRDFAKSPCDMRSKMETRMTIEALRRRLDKKFEKTKHLLRTNQITGLDAKPPSFRPPPPPKGFRKCADPNKLTGINGSVVNDVILTGVHTSLSRATSPNFTKNPDIAIKQNHTYPKLNSFTPPDDTLNANLCNACSKRRSSIGALSKLVSPNVLQRPPLGLSYSMEDDLSPGIKEIRSSTPKPDYDQDDAGFPSPKESPVVFLSTFSHSVSSLGDGSSQSDSDFSFSQESGKVPLTCIRSMTLPMDLKLGPSVFYSSLGAVEDEQKPKSLTHGCSDLGLGEMRSSSAPPPPPGKSHWKKDTKRLEKNDKGSRNGDSADLARTEADEDTMVDKPKKRGIWKSILRRK